MSLKSSKPRSSRSVNSVFSEILRSPMTSKDSTVWTSEYDKPFNFDDFIKSSRGTADTTSTRSDRYVATPIRSPIRSPISLKSVGVSVSEEWINPIGIDEPKESKKNLSGSLEMMGDDSEVVECDEHMTVRTPIKPPRYAEDELDVNVEQTQKC
ncbi:hypothetical protein M3Y98_01176600 [Aphelenchoides besseyi]|nr:hypothetical protein M3Y98_01176600 [Aphelenchoides besseyi]KAI6211024.1 hypothetical protein M3Y96_00389600 [Aphelenchoides besseyi]